MRLSCLLTRSVRRLRRVPLWAACLGLLPGCISWDPPANGWQLQEGPPTSPVRPAANISFRPVDSSQGSHSNQHAATLGVPEPADGIVQTLYQQSPADTPDKGVPDRLPPPNLATPTLAMPNPKLLTLEAAVQEALAADPKIRAGAETITQANADLWTATLLPNPWLNASQTLMPLTRPFTVDRQGGPPQFDVGLSFPVDWLLFGKRIAAMDSARVGVTVASAEFADLVRQRLAATANAYYDLLEAKALVRIAREDLESLRRLEEVGKARVKAGWVGSIEADQMRLVVLEAERELVRREAAVATAKSNLRALLGRAGPDVDFDVAGTLEVTAPVETPPLETAVRLAEQQRPDVVALLLRVNKAEADIRAERAKAHPEVIPKVGYTRQFQQKAIGFPDANSWGIGIDMGLPLFDRKQGAIYKAQSLLTQAMENLRAQQLVVRSEVEQALLELQTAQKSVVTQTAARLKTAKSVRDRLQAAFQAGDRPLHEVVDAQAVYRDTARLYVTDHAAYWRAVHRLNTAIGKQITP